MCPAPPLALMLCSMLAARIEPVPTPAPPTLLLVLLAGVAAADDGLWTFRLEVMDMRSEDRTRGELRRRPLGVAVLVFAAPPTFVALCCGLAPLWR